MKKKILSFIIALALIFTSSLCLVACGGGGKDKKDNRVKFQVAALPQGVESVILYEAIGEHNGSFYTNGNKVNKGNYQLRVYLQSGYRLGSLEVYVGEDKMTLAPLSQSDTNNTFVADVNVTGDVSINFAGAATLIVKDIRLQYRALNLTNTELENIKIVFEGIDGKGLPTQPIPITEYLNNSITDGGFTTLTNMAANQTVKFSVFYDAQNGYNSGIAPECTIYDNNYNYETGQGRKNTLNPEIEYDEAKNTVIYNFEFNNSYGLYDKICIDLEKKTQASLQFNDYSTFDLNEWGSSDARQISLSDDTPLYDVTINNGEEDNEISTDYLFTISSYNNSLGEAELTLTFNGLTQAQFNSITQNVQFKYEYRKDGLKFKDLEHTVNAGNQSITIKVPIPVSFSEYVYDMHIATNLLTNLLNSTETANLVKALTHDETYSSNLTDVVIVKTNGTSINASDDYVDDAITYRYIVQHGLSRAIVGGDGYNTNYVLANAMREYTIQFNAENEHDTSVSNYKKIVITLNDNSTIELALNGRSNNNGNENKEERAYWFEYDFELPITAPIKEINLVSATDPTGKSFVFTDLKLVHADDGTEVTEEIEGGWLDMTQSMRARNLGLVDDSGNPIQDGVAATAICDDNDDHTVSGTCDFGEDTFDNLINDGTPWVYDYRAGWDNTVTMSAGGNGSLAGNLVGDTLTLTMHVAEGYIWVMTFTLTETVQA